MNNIFQLYQQMMQNPMGLLAQKFNIPQNVNANDPDAILNHLLNTGQVSQQQINHAIAMRNNPAIQTLMRGNVR